MRLTYGGALLALVLLGLVVHGSTNLLAVLSGGALALVLLGRGLLFLLQPFYWPAGAPAGINGHYRDVLPILEQLRRDPLYVST